MKALNYIQKNKKKFLNELVELLKIPSISADSKYKQDVLNCAAHIKKQFDIIGVDKSEVMQTTGFPIVYAEKIIDKSLPTVLVYGHYDVQPVDPIELWNSPPFKPEIKNEKIYARGACDDKGQFFIHLKAFEAMQETGELHCNLKFIIEGEEEIGSPSLEQFIKEHKDLLKSDVILVSDTSMLSLENPSTTVGLRGLSYLEIEVTGANRDLHSGTYGGAVANPINTLCEMIASLKDENNRITIPGFYDDVEVLSSSQRQKIQEIPFDEEEYKKELEIDAVEGEKGYSTLERIGIRPTLDVNGIWGGYIGEGAKTVLPSKAFAKISMRLVPNQSHQKITELFVKHFNSIAPKSVKVKMTPHHGGNPVITPTDSIAFEASEKAFLDIWGKKNIPTRDGGSVPIVALFNDVLKVNTVLLGFGLDSDAIHSPNESFGVFNFYKGIETVVAFHKHFTSLKNSDTHGITCL